MRRALAATAAGALGILALAGPAAAGNTDRPFAGSASGDVVWVEGGDFADCTDTPGWGAQYTIRGHASHLGRVTIVGSHCASEAPSGAATMTAANGDELDIEYQALEACSYTPTGQGLCLLGATVTGGTGRFDDASGQFTWTVQLDATPGWPADAWPAATSWTGELGY